MDEQEMQRQYSQLLGLNGTELETMTAVWRHCRKFGVATGVAGGIGMGGVGSMVVPVVGSVPGWLVGFAAGFFSGTLVCSMGQRGAVIEALKHTLSFNGRTVNSEREALDLLHFTLSRLGPDPERHWSNT